MTAKMARLLRERIHDAPASVLEEGLNKLSHVFSACCQMGDMEEASEVNEVIQMEMEENLTRRLR